MGDPKSFPSSEEKAPGFGWGLNTVMKTRSMRVGERREQVKSGGTQPNGTLTLRINKQLITYPIIPYSIENINCY